VPLLCHFNVRKHWDERQSVTDEALYKGLVEMQEL